MLYSVFAAIRGELLKQADQEKYQVLRLMANALSISFSWWVAITLAILLTWVFEASFRRNGNVLFFAPAAQSREMRIIDFLNSQKNDRY
jgi:hypothetical protein